VRGYTSSSPFFSAPYGRRTLIDAHGHVAVADPDANGLRDGCQQLVADTRMLPRSRSMSDVAESNLCQPQRRELMQVAECAVEQHELSAWHERSRNGERGA